MTKVVMSKGGEMAETGVGFSWTGFFFNIGWLMVKGLWVHAGIMFVAVIAVSLVFRHNPGLVWLLSGLAVGSMGWKWHRAKLQAQGYQAPNR